MDHFRGLLHIPSQLLRDAASAPMDVSEGLEGLSAENRGVYAGTVVRRMQTRKRLGDYAVERRKKVTA